MEQTLRPGDILLFRPAGWGILLPVVRWLVTYDHVALYWTETRRGLPLIIESIGRGVLIRSLFAYAGWQVRLMRPKVDDELAARVAREAERLADNPGSWYGYFDIPRYVLPKLILAKIGQLLPSRWALTLRLLAISYRRNNLYICSELVAEAYRWGYDEQGLWISDRGKGVAVADFLLGPPKLKPDWAHGKFGEGMKIGALALIRKGYAVKVETVGRELWVVFLQQKVNGTADTLGAIWRPNGTVRGTKFHVIGYSGPAFEHRFAVNLPKSAILWETLSTVSTPLRRYNQLFDASLTEGASIYARDIWMKDIKSLFAYNLWGFEMAPDRHGPKNESDMWVDMGRL